MRTEVRSQKSEVDELMPIAAEWRRQERLAGRANHALGGFVVIFAGKVCGWVTDLTRKPEAWMPGCLAVASDGRIFIAEGGDEDRGAESWRGTATHHSPLTTHHSRRAFTLVELLVAIGIIVLLMGLVLYFYPKREVRSAADGASQLQSYLAGARTRALRDQQPVGVRLLSTDNGITFTGCQLVVAAERFAPIDPGGIGGSQALTVYLDLPAGNNIQAAIRANPNLDPTTLNTARQVGVPLQGNVEVGDMLEIVDVTPSIHRIVAIDYASNTMRLAAGKELVESNNNGVFEPALGEHYFVTGVPNVNCTAAARLGWNYRYLRGPRPLLGEQTFQLPKDVVIRGVTGTIPGSRKIPTDGKGNYEIRFAPGGEVVNANGTIVLWIDDVNGVAKPVLLAIYPNGAVAAHPVGPAGNEYQFTADGKGSGQ